MSRVDSHLFIPMVVPYLAQVFHPRNLEIWTQWRSWGKTWFCQLFASWILDIRCFVAPADVAVSLMLKYIKTKCHEWIRIYSYPGLCLISLKFFIIVPNPAQCSCSSLKSLSSSLLHNRNGTEMACRQWHSAESKSKLMKRHLREKNV